MRGWIPGSAPFVDTVHHDASRKERPRKEGKANMKRTLVIACFAALVLSVLGSGAAQAGAKLKINDDASIDLGFRLQVLNLFTDLDRDGDGNFESTDSWRVRRARFRLKGIVNKHVEIFLQSDVVGNDVRLIDAFMTLKKDNWNQFIVGLNMAPILRQNLTSSGALLAIDRPALAYKSLTWGARLLAGFATATSPDTSGGFSNGVGVRDIGITYFGSGDVGDNGHVKYYLGTYNGIQAGGRDGERYTARIQYNIFDAEPGYYNLATYLGKKKTVGFGFGYDTQDDVGEGANGLIDYEMITADLFAEVPAGNGTFTFEAAYEQLDLSDDPDWLRVQGDGFYVQLGYLIGNKKWQPWFLYQEWGADDPSGKGSAEGFRAGISYFIAGHNANIKIGYAQFDTDALIGETNEDSVESLVIGFFVTY